jgi:hypothetical protein
MPLTIQEFKIEILKLFIPAPTFGLLKFNLLGKPPILGSLEQTLHVTLDDEQRALAAKAFDELRADGLIRATYTDLNQPENWCKITDAGRSALLRGNLDDLDAALSTISPHLVEVRRGAWAALKSSQPDSLRQAAHSGRELIDQTLKEGVTDAEVKAGPDFSADSSSKSGVTRRMRLKLLMRKRQGSVSNSDLAIVETSCDLVEAIDNKLKAQSHARSAPTRDDVSDALNAAEIALRRILL